MGNICNSGLNDKNEISSDQSDESFRLSSNRELSNTNLRSQTVSEYILHNSIKDNSNNIPESKNCSSDTKEAVLNGLPITSHQKTSPPSMTCETTIFGNITDFFKLKQAERYKKIVLYILSADSSENNFLRNLIYMLHEKFEILCKTEDFEIIISDTISWESTYFGAIYKTLIFNNEKQHIFQVKNVHEKLNLTSKVASYISTAYVVPILIWEPSVGKIHQRIPHIIERKDFEHLLEKANSDEIDLLKKWFQIEESPDPICYMLKEYTEANLKENVNDLHSLATVLTKLFSNESKDLYMVTALEEELDKTILRNEELAKRCVWFQIYRQCSSVLDNQSFDDHNNIFSKLTKLLDEKNIVKIIKSHNSIEEDFLSTLYRSLEKSIREVFKDFKENSMPSNTNGISVRLLKEIRLASNYAMALADRSSSEDNMSDIKRYIEGKTQFPLMIIGRSDIGKSVLVSKVVENLWKLNNDYHIIIRYANLSEDSSDLTSILGSIANQLSIIIKGSHCKVDHTVDNYSILIKDYLEATNLSIILVIDSLDKFQNYFDCIPMKLSSTAKVILTIRDICGEIYTLQNKFLEQGIPKQNILKFTKKLNSENHVNLRNMDEPQCFPNTNCRVSKILKADGICEAKELCSLSWHECCTEENTYTSAIFDSIFSTLEKTFSSDYISFILLMIAVTNWGMRESDCIQIFRKYSKTDPPEAFSIWSKLCWVMGPMIINLDTIRIAINNFRDAVIIRYTHKQRFVHHTIKDYFEIQPNIYTPSYGTTTSLNLQKLLKLPFHFLHSLEEESSVRKSEEFYKSYFFTDLDWTNNKVIASGSFPLLSDIAIAKRVFQNCAVSNIHMDVLEKFIKNYFNELNYDGHQFITLFQYFLRYKIDNRIEHKFNKVVTAWLNSMEQIKSTYLEIVSGNFQNQMCKTFSGYDMLVYLPNKLFQVATLSTAREEICIWDIQTCKRIREFTGIPQPTAIYPVSNVDAAVLCNREIKVINLIEGNFKVTLKGVMNQKMPYFGQHDEKHLVCLSRNRMYVNLMNLESGDCVTTFKAGEDRFLNSLLVSGDGRILVCGDETQKPFPLLVWHLSQRKLLYDLRIPHHEFVTSLAAITYEGAYVCIVAKEINESTPNFIVVYDLQSGTMFKKWKPGCNTVSLAISQSNASVISGLENANIQIWDLVTGNCRSTLKGHNAPVSFLRLDPFGNVLLSRNKENNDRSIRLWEIATGLSLAVFTPPSLITNCEILPNGIYIVLTLQDFKNIFTLTLKNFSEINLETLSQDIDK